MASKICRKFLKAHGNSRLFFVSKIAPGNITHRKYSLIQNNPYIQFLNYSRPCRRLNFQVRCSSTLSVRSKGRIQSLSFGQNLQYGVQRYCTNTAGYEEFQDKVKQLLSKSPTGTKEKLDEQLAVLQILCQHKAGTVTSADVTEAAKNINGDTLYELALVVYTLQEQDRTIRLWSVKDFNERDHKYIRGNVEWDHATKINLTPDARAFISALANGNTIRVFKVQKKHDGAGNTVTGELDFPQQHKADIINVGVSASGKFIMSCSNDTTIVIWNLKGEVLETLNTNQVNNSFACISPCGRFVASAGFTSDVKLYEVEFSKSGDFKQVSRAMDLKGHSAGVYHFSFSSDCTRMSTVSKDGTWKIWNIDVEYKEGQDPSLLMTGVYSGHHNNMFIGISPDAYVVAITMGRSIGVFNTTTGELEELLENVHSDDISSLTWHPSSHFFASAGGADKHIRVWHNTAGIKAQIRDLEDQLKKVKTESLKTRLEHIILEARSTLEKISS